VALFFWLSAFYFVYCARPEDWIPGLAYIPLAKFTVCLRSGTPDECGTNQAPVPRFTQGRALFACSGLSPDTLRPVVTGMEGWRLNPCVRFLKGCRRVGTHVPSWLRTSKSCAGSFLFKQLRLPSLPLCLLPKLTMPRGCKAFWGGFTPILMT